MNQWEQNEEKEGGARVGESHRLKERKPIGRKEVGKLRSREASGRREEACKGECSVGGNL